MTFAKYPIGGSGTGGVETVADAAARGLLVPSHGDLVVQLDTNELYEYNGTSWAVIADRTYNDPIVNADISASAAIDRSKLASGTVDHVLINNASGVMSSEAQLAKTRGGTGADNTAVTFPTTGVIVTEAGTQTLTNKTLTSPSITTPTGIVKGDVGLGNVDNTSDATKNAASVSLTNKTIDADLNTITNIENADIKAGAAIDRAKLASGSANHAIINDGSGVMSSEAQLATTRGGTGVNSTATFPTSGVLVTEAGTQTLTNKTLTSPVISSISNTGTLTLPTSTDTLVGRSTTDTLLNKTVSSTAATTGALTLPSGTAAQRPSPAAGMTRLNTDSNEFEGYANGAWQSIGGGLNEQPIKNYLKTYATASIAPGTLSTLASTTDHLVSLTAFYADSTSGSSALTNPSDTTLRGSTNYLTATGASNPAGQRFVQLPAFALEGSDLGKPISLSFDVHGVTADGNWDVVVVRYNSSGTHQSIISVAGNASSGTTPVSAKLPTGTTTFNGFFVPDSTTAGDLYAVRLRSLANTVQIRFDNLFCGQQPIRTGGSVTDWQSYTPTGPYTTNATYTGRWRRVGDSINVVIDLSFSGATDTASCNFSMAQVLNGLGLTVNTSGLPSSGDVRIPVGSFTVLDSLAAIYSGLVTTNSTSTLDCWTSAGTQVSNTNPIALGFGDNIALNITLPITGWSSNVTMADRAVEEFLSVASGTTTPTVYGAAGSVLGTGRAGQTITLTTQTVIQPTDAFIIEFKTATGTSWSQRFMYYETGALGYGVQIAATTSSNTFQVFFGAAGRDAGTGNTWDAISTFLWRVRKCSGGAQVGFPINSANLVGRTDGNAPAAGMVGEMFGTSRAGTGGKTYSTRTTTAATNSLSSLVSITLNKGIYLVSAAVEQGVTSGSTFLSGEARIGSTAITGSISTATAVGAYGLLSFTFPVEISTDSTAVAIWGLIGVGTSAGADNEMWAIRIA